MSESDVTQVGGDLGSESTDPLACYFCRSAGLRHAVGTTDLNLRPLDPQGGPASAMTRGNRLCAGRSGAVGRSSGMLWSAYVDCVLQICSTYLSQDPSSDGVSAPLIRLQMVTWRIAGPPPRRGAVRSSLARRHTQARQASAVPGSNRAATARASSSVSKTRTLTPRPFCGASQ
jgi:hypothetical protein